MAIKLTQEQAINNFSAIHGNRYDYSLVEYVNTGTKVKIICREHGVFEQMPETHTAGRGCKACGVYYRGLNQRKSTSDFIDSARATHGDRYNYDSVVYLGAHTHVDIECARHGIFRQMPNNHRKGNGCPACTVGNRRSMIAQTWIESLSPDLIFEYQIPENKRLFADGYLPATNTVYQFHGDYWHGNPATYPSDGINPHSKKTFGELHQRTLQIESEIVSLGYNLVVMWESEWRAQISLRDVTTRSTKPRSRASSADIK